MAEKCNRCRFWLEDMPHKDPNDPDWGFGRCRREPPRISDAYVAAIMPRLEYGQQVDPEIATVQMTTASLFPATCSTDWCGQFEAVQERVLAEAKAAPNGEARVMSAQPQLTDKQLIADLRERGVVGPISDDFLADYRRDREFMELASRVEAIPGAPAKFKRALIRLGILPPDEPGDATLLGAWERFKTAEREIEANGPDAPEETDAPAWAAWNAADEVVLIAPATTIKGAIVKLRRSILMTTSGSRPTNAIINDDDTDLFAQAEELDVPTQLAIDALAALMLVVAEQNGAVLS